MHATQDVKTTQKLVSFIKTRILLLKDKKDLDVDQRAALPRISSREEAADIILGVFEIETLAQAKPKDFQVITTFTHRNT